MRAKKILASRITRRGQITIPLPIRRQLGVEPGDRVEYVIEPDGRVVMLPATVDASQLEGMLAPPPRRVTLEEMRAAIRKRGGRR